MCLGRPLTLLSLRLSVSPGKMDSEPCHQLMDRFRFRFRVRVRSELLDFAQLNSAQLGSARLGVVQV